METFVLQKQRLAHWQVQSLTGKLQATAEYRFACRTKRQSEIHSRLACLGRELQTSGYCEMLVSQIRGHY
jgi:hypothetical protein